MNVVWTIKNMNNSSPLFFTCLDISWMSRWILYNKFNSFFFESKSWSVQFILHTQSTSSKSWSKKKSNLYIAPVLHISLLCGNEVYVYKFIQCGDRGTDKNILCIGELIVTLHSNIFVLRVIVFDEDYLSVCCLKLALEKLSCQFILDVCRR